MFNFNPRNQSIVIIVIILNISDTVDISFDKLFFGVNCNYTLKKGILFCVHICWHLKYGHRPDISAWYIGLYGSLFLIEFLTRNKFSVHYSNIWGKIYILSLLLKSLVLWVAPRKLAKNLSNMPWFKKARNWHCKFIRCYLKVKTYFKVLFFHFSLFIFVACSTTVIVITTIIILALLLLRPICSNYYQYCVRISIFL